MLTGTALLNELVDELNELKLSHMAATLDGLYHQPGFLEMDHMTLIAELIGPEFREKVSKVLTNRLRAAKLFGSPEELPQCKYSDSREYLPGGITELLSSLEFIERGYNVCILGASDAGKTYLAKAIGIQACNRFNVGYFHSEELLESMVAMKEQDYEKFAHKLKRYLKLDLVILDDFLLHTITDEREIKILFELLEKRNEQRRSTIICSQRNPDNWKAMILNDEVSANSILKRATKHYTIIIKNKENQ
jgi:DNA replication protein DnaC